MTHDPQKKKFQDLRSNAEQTIVKLSVSPGAFAGDPDTHRLLHELQVYQVELEMRNEELLRAVEDLSESEARYRRITEGLTDYLYSVRIDNGHAVGTTQNPACEKVTGYTPEELAANPYLWLEMVVPEDRDMVTNQVNQAIAGIEIPPIEHRIIRKDGKQRWVRNTIIHFHDPYGNLSSYDGVIQDITERKKAEEERELLGAQLQQAQKMEAVGRLAGGVAHDFNNLLTVILGCSCLSLMEADPAQPLYEYLQSIQHAAEKSAELTQQLLAFARKQTIIPEILDLNETLTGMVKMLKRLIGEDIDLTWQPDSTLWPIKADPSQLNQILANLCVNARDAITGVGTITIATGNRVFDERFCVSHDGCVPGEYAWFSVSDDGSGMDKKTLGKIFEPFFTTKEAGKGTGLGLATVYGAVKQNNGFIDVTSESGVGTTFTIYLPRHADEDVAAEKESATTLLPCGTETILLVEDQTDILKMTSTSLGKLGYTVLTANTPGKAIQLAKEYGEGIQLLITDIVMPEENGKEMAIKLTALFPDLKTLFISGYTADIIAHQGVLDEGIHFIKKPFSLPALASKIREVLEG